MKKKFFLILFGILAFQFLFSSCDGRRKEKFMVSHPTTADQINFFVSKANDDVALIARMLEVDESVLNGVRFGTAEPSSELVKKLDNLVSNYCGWVFLRWRKTKTFDYDEGQWYDWAILLLADFLTVGAAEL